ncbi:helix-turn-helix transcriptional regulator [Ochrobactrum sp. C6C9]|uniref:helix-turn-helix domain-containing protein n=1 Tax=Ochrobactrum sp. C6C9 TaxID=2736662 RepID=UPI0035302ACA|nr:helix-turn-helix transcriptional regulator [Ochrobactrum sp. C6C9]
MQQRDSVSEIGRRLAEVRQDLGFHQIPFAETLGVSQSAYKNYERGERETPTRLIIEICNRFGVSPAWILLNRGSKFQKDAGDLLEDAVIATDEFLQQRSIYFSPEKKARVVRHLYEYALEHGELGSTYTDSALSAFAA